MKPSIKQVFAVILAIILGAIGSGVWDYLLEPCFKIFSGVLLTIITFGIKGLEDNIYLSIAKGFHEGSSLLVLMHFYSIISGFFISIIVLNNARFKTYLIGSRSKGDENILNEGCSDVQTFDDTYKKRYKFIIILIVIFFIVMTGWMIFRHAYVNDQITYYNQLYDTVAPFIDENEQLMIKSEFAQIESKDDYDVLINRLKKIADEYNQTYKEYTLLY